MLFLSTRRLTNLVINVNIFITNLSSFDVKTNQNYQNSNGESVATAFFSDVLTNSLIARITLVEPDWMMEWVVGTLGISALLNQLHL